MVQGLSVGVVGLGYFSQFHLQAWNRIGGVQLVGATDTDPARRAWAHTQFGAPVFEQLDDVLAKDPDIIDLIVPPQAQADIIRACLAPDRVLICQKPFCTSLDEARDIADAADAAGTRLIIHENFRFQPWHRAIGNFLHAGRLGRVYSAQFLLRPGDGRGPQAYLDRQPGFRTMPRLLVHETGVHFIDLFRWLFGPVTSVYADLRQLNPVLQGEDSGVFVLEHASGTRATFDGNRLSDHETDAPRRTMGDMRIEGEAGTLTLDGYGSVKFRPFGTQDAEEIALPFAPDDTFGGGCVHALNCHIVEAIRTRGSMENDVRAYLPVIDITGYVYESDKLGRKLAYPG